jgi:hypothetical protein
MENLDFIIATIIVSVSFLALILGTYQEFTKANKAEKK